MRAWSLVWVVLLAACSPVTGSSPELGEDFRLPYREQVVLDDGRLTVSFQELLEDSRCPQGVQCAWAGEAAVRLSLAVPEREPTVLILRTTPGKEVASIVGYRVELRRVDPAPTVGRPPPEEYVATLRIRKE